MNTVQIESQDYEYMSMDEFDGNWWFYDESIRVPDNDILLIKPFTKMQSERLWEKFISKRNRHFMLLDGDEFITIGEPAYKWLDDWNDYDFNKMSTYLRKSISYKYEDYIIVFYMKEISIRTTWNIFLKHWINFLFEDEGTIVLNPKSECILVFSNGLLFVSKYKDTI